MTKGKPLWHELYLEPLYTELARIVGYAGVSLEEARTQAPRLAERYGKDTVQADDDEISILADGWVSLRPEARKLCHQLLGPEPPKGPKEPQKKKPRKSS